MSIEEVKRIAREVKAATVPRSNSAFKIGELFESIIDLIENIRIEAPLSFKGTVETTSTLPERAENGDTYYVTGESAFYTYTGESFLKTIDIDSVIDSINSRFEEGEAERDALVEEKVASITALQSSLSSEVGRAQAKEAELQEAVEEQRQALAEVNWILSGVVNRTFTVQPAKRTYMLSLKEGTYTFENKTDLTGKTLNSIIYCNVGETQIASHGLTNNVTSFTLTLDEDCDVYYYRGGNDTVDAPSVDVIKAESPDIANQFPVVKAEVEALSSEVGELTSDIASTEAKVEAIINGEDVEIMSTSMSMTVGGYYNSAGAFVNNSSSKYGELSISDYQGLRLTVKIDEAAAISSRCSLIEDSEGHVLTYTLEKNYENGVWDLIVPAGANKLLVSINKDLNPNNPVVKAFKTIGAKDSEDVAYVSPNGSDDNEGTATDPFATVNAALKKGARTVMIKAGVYRQRIKLSLATADSLTLSAVDNMGRVIFKPIDNVIATTESAVQGKTRVKVVPCQSAPSPWIFQESVEDVATLIDNSERHALQRGCNCRCEDTRIVACTSDNVSDALTEIEESTTYLYFYDSGNSLLYFSRPEEVTANNPIIKATGAGLFEDTNTSVRLRMNRIECCGLPINLVRLINPELVDCKVRSTYAAGAFSFDYCNDAKFIRCEASSNALETTGDGFNGHNSVVGADYLAKGTTATLIDCWSHDNKDDGYSDHECSEMTIIGGLFEYNGKGGVTPSYGSHCTCYSVYSRHNYNGFFYAGAPTSDQGKHGQLLCNSCVAEKNGIGAIEGAGFRVNGYGNTVILVNCKSLYNYRGFQVAQNDQSITAIDCGSLGDINPLQGNVVIRNTTPLL